MPKPTPNETHDEFLNRCMGDTEMVTNYDNTDQRYAVCESNWQDYVGMSIVDRYIAFITPKISFDYDGILSTKAGKEKAAQLIKDGNTIYIISARGNKEPMLKIANDLGIAESRIYAMGSNKAKVEKIKELGIVTHYDNNPDVIKELGTIGKLFTNG